MDYCCIVRGMIGRITVLLSAWTCRNLLFRDSSADEFADGQKILQAVAATRAACYQNR